MVRSDVIVFIMLQISHILIFAIRRNPLIPEPESSRQAINRGDEAYTVDIPTNARSGDDYCGMGHLNGSFRAAADEDEQEDEERVEDEEEDAMFDSKGRPRVDKMGNTIEYSDEES
jgi:hypothetical protein